MVQVPIDYSHTKDFTAPVHGRAEKPSPLLKITEKWQNPSLFPCTDVDSMCINCQQQLSTTGYLISENGFFTKTVPTKFS